MKGRTCPKEVMCLTRSTVKTFHILFFTLFGRKSLIKFPHIFLSRSSDHLEFHGVLLDLVAAWVSRFEAERNLAVVSYTCTDGTLLLRTCPLISWTLVMIFFWWPISVTPSRWISLHDTHKHTHTQIWVVVIRGGQVNWTENKKKKKEWYDIMLMLRCSCSSNINLKEQCEGFTGS